MTRRSQVSIDARENLRTIRRQRTATKVLGLTPLHLYDIWGSCHAHYHQVTPEPPRPEIMERATLDGTIYEWFPSIGQSLKR